MMARPEKNELFRYFIKSVQKLDIMNEIANQEASVEQLEDLNSGKETDIDQKESNIKTSFKTLIQKKQNLKSEVMEQIRLS